MREIFCVIMDNIYVYVHGVMYVDLNQVQSLKPGGENSTSAKLRSTMSLVPLPGSVANWEIPSGSDRQHHLGESSSEGMDSELLANYPMQ